MDGSCQDDKQQQGVVRYQKGAFFFPREKERTHDHKTSNYNYYNHNLHLSNKQITVCISNRLIQSQLYKKKTMATNSIKLLTGNSHPELAKKVAERYNTSPLPSSSPPLL